MDVINTIDAIMESNNSMGLSDIYYSTPWGKYINLDSEGYAYVTMKAELNSLTYFKDVKDKFTAQLTSLGESFSERNIEVSNVDFINKMSTTEDVENYNKQKDENN